MADPPAGAWRLAFRGDVVRRALLFASTVGPVLVGINHADAIAEGRVDTRRGLQIVLTLAVPYAVSTVSSVLALRGGGGDGPGAG